jgi:DNA polymerase III epsilon subunit-like protein
MKYVSIDIETLGLNIDAPIIEVACVFVNNGKIIGEEQTYVCHDKYDNCEPYAMAMHPETLRIISDGPTAEGVQHINWLDITIRDWLIRHDFNPDVDKVVFAGKNAAGFDIPMLEKQCKAFKKNCRPHHRVLDPGPMFTKRGDYASPNLPTILEEQQLAGQVSHTALDDARAVVAAVERFFDLQEELGALRVAQDDAALDAWGDSFDRGL